MNKTIVFIHGMFQNPRSWDRWVAYFQQRGWQCHAPAWPLHEGDPAQLRANPPAGLGDLSLERILQTLEAFVETLPEQPVIVGHSVGGLITQLLVNKGLANLGVCISSVAPNRMLSFDWGFIKNSALINNPLAGNEPFFTDLETFHGAFCNTLTIEETRAPFNETATHDSRNVLRDCLGSHGEVDVERPHAPLLFVSGEEDAIIRFELVEKNAKAYSDPSSIVDVKIFPGRDHFICGEPGWEEVAGYVADWVQSHTLALT